MKKTLILFFLLPIYLFGNFSALNNGARSLGMGNTFVALSDDASAVFYNPAGLGRVQKLSSIASYQNMYGIKGLHNSMLSVTVYKENYLGKFVLLNFSFVIFFFNN